MSDFNKIETAKYVIEQVNLQNATVKEALQFKKHLDLDISLGYKTIIIDLGNCESLDPAFFGVIVVTLKQLMRIGGTIKIVKPGLFSETGLTINERIQIFELYNSLDEAIESINSSSEKT
jgi:anti-anti-sigma regulatory factor